MGWGGAPGLSEKVILSGERLRAPFGLSFRRRQFDAGTQQHISCFLFSSFFGYKLVGLREGKGLARIEPKFLPGKMVHALTKKKPYSILFSSLFLCFGFYSVLFEVFQFFSWVLGRLTSKG